MKVDIKKLPQSEIEIFCELEPNEWGEFVLAAGKELSREVKIDGFRPGMAPTDLVEQKVGLGKILERAADMAVKKTYARVIMEKNIEVISRPEIQVLKIAKNNPFEFKAKVAVLPEVKLGDYQKIARREKKPGKDEMKVEEKEVEKSLDYLRKSRAKYITVARPAQAGDRVEVNFLVKLNGQVIEGGESKNHPLIIGENRFIPGFEDNISGMKEGEEKKFQLLFPTDYQAKDLAGQLADFEVKMTLIQEQQLPELDDDFAKSLGKFNSLAALKDSIKEGAGLEKEQKVKEIWRVKVLEKIIKESETDLPDILVEMELDKMIEEMKANLAQVGLAVEEYFKNIKKTEADLRKEWQIKARQRVAAALILRAIAGQEKIEISGQELEAENSKFLAHYPDLGTAGREVDLERLNEYNKERLKNEKVFQLLENIN